MTRLIDADKLKEVFENLASDDYNVPIWYQQTVFETIDDAPTVERPKNNRGYWEEIIILSEVYDIEGVKTWASKMRCSKCGFTTIAIEGKFTQYNGCPNCFADMRKEADHETN